MKKRIDGFNDIPISTEQDIEHKGKGVLICIIFILIFLIALLICIKMNVGGFGRKVLRPILKDVPVVNAILPDATDEEIAKETGYHSLAQAVAEIDKLEKEIEQLKAANAEASSDAVDNAQASRVQELENEIKKLKVYEQNQKTFESTKQQFYQEVVYNDNVDVENYTKWYEQMDADTAAKLYKEAVQTQQASQKEKELAQSYAAMEPNQAARILEKMTGDLDTVAGILNTMSAKDRGEIMGEMDAAFAAKITKKISS